MFLNYGAVAAFGVSAVVTFFVVAVLLLMYAAKKGMLRVGARHTPLLPQHAQPKILTPFELMPLKVEKISKRASIGLPHNKWSLLPMDTSSTKGHSGVAVNFLTRTTNKTPPGRSPDAP
ncbi:hypothetical protein evm_013167 [Chilo suppressalis]|nr:hypothetical protein evm_013167 [Chilo suppressalis]